MPSERRAMLSVLETQTTFRLNCFQEKALRILAQDIRDPSPLLPWPQKEQGHPAPKTKASKDRKDRRKVRKEDSGMWGKESPATGRPGCPREDWTPAQHWRVPATLFPSEDPLLLYQLLLTRAKSLSFPDCHSWSTQRPSQVCSIHDMWNKSIPDAMKKESHPLFCQERLKKQQRVIHRLDGHPSPVLPREPSDNEDCQWGRVYGRTAEETISRCAGCSRGASPMSESQVLGCLHMWPLGNDSAFLAMHYA